MWERGAAAWAGTGADAACSPPAAATGDGGLRSAGGVPVRSEGQVVAVIELRARAPRPPDRELEQSLGVIANQVGRFLAHRRAEEALRQSDELLRQSQKMDAMGRLAGGVAHDFNNLLSIIMGFSDLTLLRLAADDPGRRDIEEINQAAQSASRLTRQLLAFSRKQDLQPQLLDLNETVAKMEQMLRRMIGEDIDLATVKAAALGLVNADPGQLEQVILNLVVNARDAMPRGGKLTIETAEVVLDRIATHSGTETRPGPYVRLAVSDTGTGMSDETRSHLFEPFFTTKESGKGTGMGLSTVYGIVQQSGGHILVYSALGRGTTFKIYLPRVVGAAPAPAGSARDRAQAGGAETILVVEDERGVREMVQEVLMGLGYHVLAAPNADGAWRIAQEFPGRIDLILTDVVMPGTSGPELVEVFSRARAETKILYMSGYTADVLVRHGLVEGAIHHIEKPLTPETLAGKVRAVLDAPPARPG